MYPIKQSTAITVPFFVHDASGDAVTGLTDGSFTKRISKNGTAFGAMTVTITELENGWYSIPLSTSHSDTNGILSITFTNAGAKQVNLQFRVETKLTDDLVDLTAAQVNTQADLALTDYDGPTNAEMIARTILAASYFDPAVDAVANVTLVATTTDVTNQVTADMTAVSGDTVAADNLEATFDGTGYLDNVAPSTQAQVGQLSTGSAAISVAAESAVITVGTEVNTYTSTAQLDGIYHEVSDTAGQLDFYYQFDVGGNGVGVSATMTGRLNGANDDLDIFAYNWGTMSWDQLLNLPGIAGTSDSESTITLLVAHTGAGADLGKVRLRAFKASGLTSATLFLDRAYLSYSVVAQSVGYALGRVWVDTVAGNAGTEIHVNGVADNASPFADAITIAGILGIHEYNVSPDSTLAPIADLNDVNVYGVGYTLQLGGHDYAGTHFIHSGHVSGTATSSVNTDHIDFVDSIIENMTIDDPHFTNCGFIGTVTLSGVGTGTPGEVRVVDCRSLLDAGLIFDFGTGSENHNAVFSNYQNKLEIRNFNVVTTGGTDLLTISGSGQLIIAASCDSGTINLTGTWEITDNSGGAVTIIQDDVATDVITLQADTDDIQTRLPAALVSGKMDSDTTAISGSTAAADQLEASAKTIVVGAAQTGTLSTTQMTTDLTEATDDHYNGRIIIWTSGVLKDQATNITDYTGVSGLLTFTATTEAPSNNDTFVIV